MEYNLVTAVTTVTKELTFGRVEMAERPLSAIPYYGGKYKMSAFLSNILDYQNTDTFVTPFGGGARVLLNKPRHQREIYMEINPSVGCLFKVLSDYDKARVLLDRIYNETDVSQECFNYHMHIKNEYENQLSRVVVEELVKGIKTFKKFHELDNSVDYAFNNAFDGIVTGSLECIELDKILGKTFTDLTETDKAKQNLLRLEENVNACVRYFNGINSKDVYTHDKEMTYSKEENKFYLDFYEKLDAEITRVREEMKDTIKERRITLSEIREGIIEAWFEQLSLSEEFRNYDRKVAEASLKTGLPNIKVIEMFLSQDSFTRVGIVEDFKYDPLKDSYSQLEIDRAFHGWECRGTTPG
jgi:hypothetical protein